jgi:hypothetical protein
MGQALITSLTLPDKLPEAKPKGAVLTSWRSQRAS